MDIRQLKAFVAIAETGRFTAGAERVNVTQAAVSMQIRLLEDELGVKLFSRLPRKAVPTDAGESLLVYARHILRLHEAARAEMDEMAGGRRGRLRIGSASAMVIADPLPTLLKALRKKHPQADILVSSGTSDSLVKSMLVGELDLAFVSLPVEASGITTDLLSRDELIVIVSPGHPRAKQKEISATTLANEKLILGGSGGNTRRLIDQFFASAKVKLTPTMELSRQTAIIRMVEENLGVGIAPLNSVRDQIASGKLIPLTIKGRDSREKIYWELGLARASGGYNSPLSRFFTKLCLTHYGKPYVPKKKRP